MLIDTVLRCSLSHLAMKLIDRREIKSAPLKALGGSTAIHPRSTSHNIIFTLSYGCTAYHSSNFVLTEFEERICQISHQVVVLPAWHLALNHPIKLHPVAVFRHTPPTSIHFRLVMGEFNVGYGRSAPAGMTQFWRCRCSRIATSHTPLRTLNSVNNQRGFISY